jgi:hypothetical protein
MKMKTIVKILFSFFILIQFNQISAQTSTTIYTPKGTSLTAWIVPEYMSDQDKLDWSDYYAYWYPQATEINPPSATTTYNCHGYAWHISEGGSLVWMGLDGYDPDPYIVENVYWTDNSYTETTEANASKISYYEGNHSAIQTSTQGIYISKWGNKCLMQHARDYGPYNMSSRKYYKLNPGINGSSSALCQNQQRTFTSNTSISGSTYSWTRNTSLLDYVSGTGTTSYCVKATSGAGTGWLQLQITTPSGEIATTDYKYVWVGTPDNTGVTLVGGYMSYPSPFPCISTNHYNVEYGVTFSYNPGGGAIPGATSYSWSGLVYQITPGWTHATFYPCHLGSPYYGSGYIMATGSNTCGSVNVSAGYGPCSGKMMVIYPNPASSDVQVTFVDQGKKSDNELMVENNSIIQDYSMVFHARVLTTMGTEVFSASRKSNPFTIPLNNLKDGTYIIVVNDGTNIYSGQLIIKH